MNWMLDSMGDLGVVLMVLLLDSIGLGQTRPPGQSRPPGLPLLGDRVAMREKLRNSRFFRAPASDL